MDMKFFSKKQRFSLGFNAGLGAGVLATVLMLLLSLFLGGISLPQALGSTIVKAMPPQLFAYLHSVVGDDAKYYLFSIILVGQCLVFALSGGLCNAIASSARFSKASNAQGQLRWEVGVIMALTLWLLTGLIFLPLTGAGAFGALLTIGVGNTMLSLAIVGVFFSLLFIFIQNWLTFRSLRKHDPAASDKVEQQYTLQRRSILRNGLFVLGLGVLGVAAWRFITGSTSSTPLTPSEQSYLEEHYISKITPAPTPNYGIIQSVENLSSEITPNDQYYIVSKNLGGDPVVDSATWHLTIDGLVTSPYTLDYQELLTMPMKQQYESMMCISNEVGGNYMSNALWEGVPLQDLLQRAGNIQPGATKVVIYAYDDYSDSIHLAKALEPTTLVAVRMNGVTLPDGHGYPARLLVPGIYGMKHVKWMTHIQVVNTDYQGYWQQAGWSDAAPIRMTSRIDTPLSAASLTAGKKTYVAGVAFSGDKGISEVDVSFDAGHSWQRATLQRPPSALTWVLWEIAWQPKPGNYNITVRAVDLAGNVQDPHLTNPAPNGASGYHTISVTAS